ncbi:SMC5-SMC6 complex localization factor protein 2-like [Argonauta hians]
MASANSSSRNKAKTSTDNDNPSKDDDSDISITSDSGLLPSQLDKCELRDSGVRLDVKPKKKITLTLDVLVADKIRQDELDRMNKELQADLKCGGVTSMLAELSEPTDGMLPEHQKKLEMLSNFPQTNINELPPWETLFEASNYCCLFNSDLQLSDMDFVPGNSKIDLTLANIQGTEQLDLILKSDILRIVWYAVSNKNLVLRWLFFLMSIHKDIAVSEASYQTVMNAIQLQLSSSRTKNTWAPDVADVLRIFINYGAPVHDLVSNQAFLSTLSLGDLQTPINTSFNKKRPTTPPLPTSDKTATEGMTEVSTGNTNSAQHTGSTNSTQHTDCTISAQHKEDDTNSAQLKDSTNSMQHKEANTIFVQHKDSTNFTQHKDSTTSTQHKDSTNTMQHTDSTNSAQHTDSTNSAQHKDSTNTMQHNSTTSTQPKDRTNSTQPKDSTTSMQHKESDTISVQHKDSNNSVHHKKDSTSSVNDKKDSASSAHHKKDNSDSPHHKKDSSSSPHHKKESSDFPHHKKDSSSSPHHKKDSSSSPHHKKDSSDSPHHKKDSSSSLHHKKESSSSPHHKKDSSSSSHHKKDSSSSVHHKKDSASLHHSAHHKKDSSNHMHHDAVEDSEPAAKVRKSDEKRFNSTGLVYVLSVLSFVLDSRPSYSTEQLSALFLMLCKVRLDVNIAMHPLVKNLQAVLSRIIQKISLSEWPEMVTSLSLDLSSLTRDPHNMLFLTQTLPHCQHSIKLRQRLATLQLYVITEQDISSVSKQDINITHLYCLFPHLKSFVRHKLSTLSICVDLLSVAVVASPLEKSHRENLQQIMHEVMQLSECLRDNGRTVACSVVKNKLVILSNRWKIFLESVGLTQKTLFSSTRIDSPEKCPERKPEGMVVCEEIVLSDSDSSMCSDSSSFSDCSIFSLPEI